MPRTTEAWTEIADEFYTKWHFPNCIGALDGKHITMRCPRNTGSLNYNYKHTFSIVLLAMCDADYRFTYIDVGCKERISDGGVYNRSTLSQALESNSINIPPPRNLPNCLEQTPFVILADDAFALKRYMMKPFNFRNQNLSERIFNYRLSRARRMIESTFGIMAIRFRLLRTTIELSEKNVKFCVLAICALHNFLINSDRCSYVQSVREMRENENSLIDEDNISIESEQNDAKAVRNTLKNYFVSPAGEVAWQYDLA